MTKQTTFVVIGALKVNISTVTCQTIFMFDIWVPGMVFFDCLDILTPLFLPRGEAKGQNLGHCKVF